jgi:hypothetical protein
MNTSDQLSFNFLYQQHLINLTLQGIRQLPLMLTTSARRITDYFERAPDVLDKVDLKLYFASLIKTHSWSTVKLDRNGLQFFYRHTLKKEWEWLNIVKPPQVKRIPDIILFALIL